MTNLNIDGKSPISRGMYGASLSTFLAEDVSSIVGKLLLSSGGSVEPTQRNAWVQQIELLKAIPWQPSWLKTAHIYFELTVPRLGRRADVVILIGHVMFILEFKVGEKSFSRYALDQVWDYALDFKNFHDASHNICVVPIQVSTEATEQSFKIESTLHNDKLAKPIGITARQIALAIDAGLQALQGSDIDVDRWEQGRYLPTPTIVEAARALYAGHAVEEISRSGAEAVNLSMTSKAVDRVIEISREKGRKAICFVTGVPGAGKTLVGLDVANRHLDRDSETYSVFLSGNGPLVAVLREALVRDRVESAKESGGSIKKVEARKEVDAFIQNVHHFRDEYLRDEGVPPEHVVLFDEAQRAWNIAQTSAFMKLKKGRADFEYSNFLLG
jgi:hypothetical protein